MAMKDRLLGIVGRASDGAPALAAEANFDPPTICLGGLFIIAVFAALYAASAIILPVILAFILKLLLQPAVSLLERARLPRAIGALLTILLVVGGLAGLGAAPPAYAAVKVGPVDQFQHLKPWCERQMRVGTILGSASPDNPWNAYSWKCRIAAFYRTAGIDMNAVCRNHYGGDTYARTNNPGWAWSWECWRN